MQLSHRPSSNIFKKHTAVLLGYSCTGTYKRYKFKFSIPPTHMISYMHIFGVVQVQPQGSWHANPSFGARRRPTTRRLYDAHFIF
eukprot:SAG31_NODE_453_length_15464_cov_37.074064_14_plen_85_part_00